MKTNPDWLPDLLIDRRPVTQEITEQPEVIRECATHEDDEPIPGSIAYLYKDYGGES